MGPAFFDNSSPNCSPNLESNLEISKSGFGEPTTAPLSPNFLRSDTIVPFREVTTDALIELGVNDGQLGFV